MYNIILFGAPGSGKGTQSAKLIEKYGLKHVSTGDLLRSEISRKTLLGAEAKILIEQGQLVPDHIVIGMIESVIDENTEVTGFLFDGFPRTLRQAEALDKLLAEKGKTISVFFALKVSESELAKRLLQRGLSSGRSDDRDEEIIKARIEEYNAKTSIVADHYKKQNKMVAIEGEGNIEEIFENLCHEIDTRTKMEKHPA